MHAAFDEKVKKRSTRKSEIFEVSQRTLREQREKNTKTCLHHVQTAYCDCLLVSLERIDLFKTSLFRFLMWDAFSDVLIFPFRKSLLTKTTANSDHSFECWRAGASRICAVPPAAAEPSCAAVP